MGDIPDDNPWSSRVGLRVLPKGFSVIDDPGLSRWDGTTLLGGYPIDDEGVVAQRVELVQNGILRRLLMSRTPSKEFRGSNGHGRYGYSTGAVGWPSNLVVRARRVSVEQFCALGFGKQCATTGCRTAWSYAACTNPPSRR